jgi:hypothetical protein
LQFLVALLRWQGEQTIDMDVPTVAEGKIVGNSPVMKSLWVFNQVK